MADEKLQNTREASGNLRTATAQPSATDKIVDEWFAQFHGSSLGNDTETWNLVFNSKEDLKRRLASK